MASVARPHAEPELGHQQLALPGGLVAILPASALVAALLATRWPLAALGAVGVGVLLVVAARRPDLALLALVATAPLEAVFALSEHAYLSPSKVAGALAFTSFFVSALVTRRRLVLDRSHALVALILAASMLSTLQATNVAGGVTTTLRYAAFVTLYVVVSQFIGDHAFQRRLAWTLSAASSVAGVLAVQTLFTGAGSQAGLPYTNPNDTAFILATTLPLTFWLLREGTARRVLALSMIALMSTAILLTFSRGALAGLAAVVLWQLVTERRHILPLLGAMAVVAVAAAVMVQANREHYHELTGRPPGTWNILVVHNAYLDVAAELGIPAALLFLAYVAMIFLRTRDVKRRREGRPGFGFASAVQAGFIVAIVSSLFLSEQYYMPLWLLGALATAMWHEERRRLPHDAP